ncbi:MAG: universal stress protein [Beijerinckiaceae bacterium]|nr:MAG: universal stress protein [Beijerinckiaceae bacterium]
MKSILIPVEDHAAIGSVLTTALRLAERFGSYMEGVALGPDFAQITAADFSLGGMIVDDQARHELLNEAYEIFSGFVQSNAIARTQDDTGKPHCSWRGDTLITDEGIGEYGRIFDVLVVGRPAAGFHQPRKATLEAAMFESGRPLLIAPPQETGKLGDCIAIAWNASPESARSVAFAMPLLLAAQDVPVMMVPGTKLAGPDEAQLVTSLRRHGVPARVIPTNDTSKGPGFAVLETAQSVNADMLIKGGYTQSRVRQFIFGGPTSQILAEATLPVFMAH